MLGYKLIKKEELEELQRKQKINDKILDAFTKSWGGLSIAIIREGINTILSRDGKPPQEIRVSPDFYEHLVSILNDYQRFINMSSDNLLT